MKKILSAVAMLVLIGLAQPAIGQGVFATAGTCIETNFSVPAFTNLVSTNLYLFTVPLIASSVQTNITVGTTNTTMVVTNSATGTYTTNSFVATYLLTNTVTVTSSASISEIRIVNTGATTNSYKWGSVITTTGNNTNTYAWHPLIPGQVEVYHDVIPQLPFSAIVGPIGLGDSNTAGKLQFQFLGP